jgi:hypothetical protein
MALMNDIDHMWLSFFLPSKSSPKIDWVALLNEILIDKTASRTFNGIDNPECILRIERERDNRWMIKKPR